MIEVTLRQAFQDVRRLCGGDSVMAVEICAYFKVRGVHFQPDVTAPCRFCGKPWDTRSCPVAGCPLGADL